MKTSEKWIDLHTHSTASDGSLSPKELVRHAKEKGLAAIALTDHDTLAGVKEALAEGKIIGVEVIPGVEISVNYKPEMHILGYFFDDIEASLEKTLETLLRNREERNPKIVRKLNELGFEISMKEVEEEAKGNVVGRPHIGKVLVKKGLVPSMEAAFDQFLAAGRPAYFKKDKLTPEQGIKAIIAGGGIPILAHPILLGMEIKELDQLLGELKEFGLRGIEAIYVENSGDDTGNLLRLAMKHGLLVTGGSDFHGNFKTGIEIGKGRGNLKVPYTLLDKMREPL